MELFIRSRLGRTTDTTVRGPAPRWQTARSFQSCDTDGAPRGTGSAQKGKLLRSNERRRKNQQHDQPSERSAAPPSPRGIRNQSLVSLAAFCQKFAFARHQANCLRAMLRSASSRADNHLFSYSSDRYRFSSFRCALPATGNVRAQQPTRCCFWVTLARSLSDKVSRLGELNIWMCI
jgi:hypothetical protein